MHVSDRSQHVQQLRQTALGHACPRCHRLWALRLTLVDDLPAVRCRYCSYERVRFAPPLLTVRPQAPAASSGYVEHVRRT